MRRLPRYVTFEPSRHGQPRYYYRRGNGNRVRLPDDPRSSYFAQAVRTAAESGVSIAHLIERPSFAEHQKREVGLTIQRIVKGAKGRARKKGMSFDIDFAWALSLAEHQQFRCCLTGIPFYMAGAHHSKINPYSPSLDRIDTSRGYTKDNVRLVVYAVNIMLMDWGESIFARVVNGYRYACGQKRNIYALTLKNGKGRSTKKG